MIVEDGTGLPNSNSYVSLEEASAYFSAMGKSDWDTIAQNKREVLLIRATDYIDNSFEWNGRKSTQEQALRFPRTSLYDDEGYLVEGIPTCLIQAVCECAYILKDVDTLFTTLEENGTVTSEKIGELAFTYDVSSRIKNSSSYQTINLRLKGLSVQGNHIVCSRVDRV